MRWILEVFVFPFLTFERDKNFCFFLVSKSLFFQIDSDNHFMLSISTIVLVSYVADYVRLTEVAAMGTFMVVVMVSFLFAWRGVYSVENKVNFKTFLYQWTHL
jgi:hypothetical protein